MKLFAISDLHVHHAENREFLKGIGPHPEDWIVLGGDIGESERALVATLRFFCSRFAKVFWVPGNHDMWTVPREESGLCGMARYERLVAICRDHGAVTPEDPYVEWQGPGERTILAPLFLLYDYTFAPDEIAPEQAVAWAAEAGLVCADETLLHPDPYPTRQALCAARCAEAEQRLSALPPDARTVLVNHFPLRRDLAVLPAIPRFSIWCGTRRTEDWHLRFRAKVVVYGHLHIPGTRYRDGVRFEEVSLGYPRQCRRAPDPEQHLRQILPAP